MTVQKQLDYIMQIELDKITSLIEAIDKSFKLLPHNEDLTR